MSARAAIRGAIGIGISIAAVIVLLQTVDVSDLGDRLSTLQPGWLLIAPVALLLQLAIRSRRWALLLGATTGKSIRTLRVAGPLAVGYLANALLPARLGEVARSILVARREAVGIGAVIASVVVERVLDLGALLAIGVATAGAQNIGWNAFALAAALLVGLGVAIWLAPVLAGFVSRVGPRAVRAPIADFLRGLAGIGPRVAGIVLALSAIAWLGDIALMWASGRALGIELSAEAAIAIAVGAALGTAIPAASGYIGTYEIGAVAIGSLAGTPPETVLAIAVVAHVLAVVPVALLGAAVVAGTGLPLTRPGDDGVPQRQAPV